MHILNIIRDLYSLYSDCAPLKRGLVEKFPALLQLLKEIGLYALNLCSKYLYFFFSFLKNVTLNWESLQITQGNTTAIKSTQWFDYMATALEQNVSLKREFIKISL